MHRFAAPLVLLLVCFSGVAGAQEPATPDAAEEAGAAAADPFANDLERSSYAVGFNIGSALVKSKLEFTLETFVAGLRDAASGEPGLLDANEVAILTQQAQNAARTRYLAARQEVVAKNRADGEAFMDEVQGKEGVVAMPSGWAYEVVREGDGPKPAGSDWVQLHYVGTLIDGTVIDSSRERGVPALLRPAGQVPAWAEALPMMNVGSVWKLYVPTDLGYGENEGAVNIPPGATLTFEIELLRILTEEEAQEVMKELG